MAMIKLLLIKKEIMKKMWFLVSLLIMILTVSCFAKVDVDHLQKISVTIKCGESTGSGTIFTRKDSTGTNNVSLIWTCGHLVEYLRKERSVIGKDGTTRKIVEFKDAVIVETVVENGRTIGKREYYAEVIKYSKVDDGEDLALLRVRKQDFSTNTVKFYLDNKIPSVGTKVYHVGSIFGEVGANSLSSGLYSYQGRLIENKIFDQTTTVVYPGSSGGGIFLKDGRYIGMATRMRGPNANYIVPIRRISIWVKKMNIEWAMDEKVKMPSDEELSKGYVEDNGGKF